MEGRQQSAEYARRGYLDIGNREASAVHALAQVAGGPGAEDVDQLGVGHAEAHHEPPPQGTDRMAHEVPHTDEETPRRRRAASATAPGRERVSTSSWRLRASDVRSRISG